MEANMAVETEGHEYASTDGVCDAEFESAFPDD